MRPQGAPDRRRAHLAAPRELRRERGWRNHGRLHRPHGGGAAPGARTVRGRAGARGPVPRPARAAAPVGDGSVRARGDAVAARRRPTADVAPVPVRGSVPDIRELTPSARSVVVGLVLAVLAVGAYFGARDTSVFAVQTLDVRGGNAEL